LLAKVEGKQLQNRKTRNENSMDELFGQRNKAMMVARSTALCLALPALSFGVFGQAIAAPGNAPAVSAPCVDQVRSTYLLGPDDELALSAPELDVTPGKTFRVDGEGDLQVPMVGRVHVAGLTVQQSEQELDKRLATYIRDPQVAIDVKELRSQPASVLGAVNSPGIHQVQGHKTLLEMISMAGGVRPDAGYSIRITRKMEWGCIPLPSSTPDASGRFSVAQVNLQNIMEAKTPEENIQILPHDVITVPKAEMIFVTGEVKKNGGFVLGEHQSMSVLQAVSLAEGLGPTADKKHAKILRLDPNADQRVEIAVDLKGILEGKSSDVKLQGNDILFVPGNASKKIALRVIEAAIQTGSGVAIYRP
jgi:polysaccharide export outer membrane protein